MSYEWFTPDLAALFLSSCEVELRVNYLRILDLLPLNSDVVTLSEKSVSAASMSSQTEKSRASESRNNSSSHS